MLPGAPARAEDDCIAKPNAPAPAGQHWWYRTDRATKRKCWFLGPQDKEAAALKADRRGQAAASAAEPEAQPAPPQETPAPVARSDAAGVTSFVFVPQESVPYLVDWTGLLKEAGIAGGEDNGLTEWADEKAARAAWAMRDSAEPAEPQATDDARAGQTPAGGADVANADVARASSAPATPSGLPASYIAALLIGGAMGPAIFSIVRARRRRNVHRNISATAMDADEGKVPAFLQMREARFAASGQVSGDAPETVDDDVSHPEDYGRPYGGEEELRRILGLSRRRAA